MSFVQIAPNGLMRLHAITRRVLVETASDEDNLRRHQEWKDYFGEISQSETEDAKARWWMHSYALDPFGTMEDWAKNSRKALQNLNSSAHRWYVDIAYDFVHQGVLGAKISPYDRAASLNFWANASQHSPLGDFTVNLQSSKNAYESALEVCTREEFPREWATIQDNLGNALSTLGENGDIPKFRQAIVSYKLALEVRTRDALPIDWATTQNNLGNAYLGLAENGDRPMFQDAFNAYKLALEVRTRDDFPVEWANTIFNLGKACLSLGEVGYSLRFQDAINVFQAALEVRTREEFPKLWADTQHILGIAFLRLGHLEDAIEAFKSALEVYTRDEFPKEWAETKINHGVAQYLFGRHTRYIEFLRNAKSTFEEILPLAVQLGFADIVKQVEQKLSLINAAIAAAEAGVPPEQWPS